MRHRKIWILVNVGTPDDPSVKSVRRYLREFLNDPKVIDIPALLRKILVNLVIVPFRAPRSAAKYRKLWTDRGSPLLRHLEDLVNRLREETGTQAGGEIEIYGAMRYGQPVLSDLLREIAAREVDSVTVLPLYPQFAESTTGSVMSLVGRHMKFRKYIIKGRYGNEATNRPDMARDPSRSGDRPGSKIRTAGSHDDGVKVKNLIGAHDHLPVGAVRIIDQFYDHPAYLEVMTKVILEHRPEEFDHILFSYHGLPLRQVQRSHPGTDVQTCTCQVEMPEHGKHCYRATCYATTRLLAEQTGITADRYTTAFQSRLSRDWMSPFTDATLLQLADEGHRKVLVVPASFVADCLETTIEIGSEYRELFLEAGGEELVMTPSLNARDEWVDAVADILKDT